MDTFIVICGLILLVGALALIIGTAVCPEIEIDETDEEYPGVQ